MERFEITVCDLKGRPRWPAPKLQQQIERIQRLPRSKQRLVIEMLDTVLAGPAGPLKVLTVAQAKRSSLVPVQDITRTILVLREQRVILDADLAAIYGVSTGRLNEAVKRNAERFPADFMFRLSPAEHTALISQFATSKPGRGGRRKLPWAFTEHGAIQAANVLNSPRAIAMGIHVVRAFIQLRTLLASNQDLARRFAQLKARLDKHDGAIAAILSAIRQLMDPPTPKRRGIGFTADLGTKE